MRPDRAAKSSFLLKQEQLSLEFDIPFDISKVEAEDIIQHNGMLDWREEVEYLTRQMTREQNSSLGTWDSRH